LSFPIAQTLLGGLSSFVGRLRRLVQFFCETELLPKPSEVRIFRLTPTVISVLDYSKGFGHTDLVAC
jgi:hypothetical protein